MLATCYLTLCGLEKRIVGAEVIEECKQNGKTELPLSRHFYNARKLARKAQDIGFELFVA